MPPPSQQISTLIKAAVERNISLSEDDLEVIRRAPAGSPLAQWVNNFDQTRLQFLDELQMWRYLQSSNNTSSNASIPVTEVLTDMALQVAVTDLEASTRCLEAQNDTLDAQYTLLARHDKQTGQRRSHLVSQASAMYKKSTLQAQHAHVANDAKLSDLESRLRARLEQLEEESSALRLRVVKKLKGDDGALEVLQSTVEDGCRRSENDLVPRDEQARVELLQKALRKAKVDEIKDSLDGMYLESLHGAHRASSPGGNRHEQGHCEAATNATDQAQQRGGQDLLVELQAEIQSLYEEIGDVAGMLVEHEHGGPLRAALASLTKVKERERNGVLSESIERIRTMTNDLELLTSEIEEKSSEKVVLESMLLTVGRIEKEMHAKARARSTRVGTPGPHNALSELVEHLQLREAGRSGHGSEEGTASHEIVVHTLDSTAHKQKQVVQMLADVASSDSNVEEALDALEDRIAEARAGLEAC